MTNQQRYIAAFRAMEKKYRDPYGLLFFKPKHCQLCNATKDGSCTFCPLFNVATIDLYPQKCVHFPSTRTAMSALAHLRYLHEVGSPPGKFPPKNEIKLEHKHALERTLSAFEKRADFHKNVADLLETLPSERFTRKGWIGFPEILEIEAI